MEQPTGPQEAASAEESGVVKRMVGVIFSPGETFASVNRSVRNADWLVPLIVGAVVALVALQLTMPVIQDMTRARLEQVAEEKEMTEAQQQKMLEMSQMISDI